MSVENTWSLAGNLAADPEPGKGATTMARLRVAVNSYDRATKSRKAKFFRVVIFGDRAEFVLKYFEKGSGIMLSGELDINEWEDKAGQKRNDIQLIAREAGFPPKGGSGATAAPHKPSAGSVSFSEEEDEEDDPFNLVS